MLQQVTVCTSPGKVTLKCGCLNLMKSGHCVSPAEVAEFENGGLWIQQQILGLDVPMTDPERMDIGQAPEQLVHVQLHTDTHTNTVMTT